MTFTLACEQEVDGCWIAVVPECCLALQRTPVYSHVTCEMGVKSANKPLGWTGRRPVLVKSDGSLPANQAPDQLYEQYTDLS
jgi:hypothetical protein